MRYKLAKFGVWLIVTKVHTGREYFMSQTALLLLAFLASHSFTFRSLLSNVQQPYCSITALLKR